MTPLFLDVQTTGASPATGGRILEVGWAVGLDALPASLVVRAPEGDIVPSRILKLTGLAAEDLAAGVAEEDAFAALCAACEGATVAVAHYARFEASFLMELWQRRAACAMPLPIICTYEIARRLYPALPSRSLRAIAGFLGHPVEAQAKRAVPHVEATRFVWAHLLNELATRESITTLDDVREWLKQKAPSNRQGARHYPLDRDLRLALPDQPGVYRMIGATGKILYVGKATSLRSRVNSYFRQRKGHAGTKLELLTQVTALDVTPCETPLEAALLETDEIKRHDPPYNVALKAATRRVCHLDAGLLQVEAGGEYRYGPFPGEDPLAALRVLHVALAGETALLLALFYRDVGVEALALGLALFAEDHPDLPSPALGLRALLAYALRYLRFVEKQQPADEDDEDEDDEIEEDDADDDAETPVTPEDVAARLSDVLLSTARAVRRSRVVRRLATAVVAWKVPGEPLWRWLSFSAGAQQAAGFAATPDEIPDCDDAMSFVPWTVATYDRLRVLQTELTGLARDGANVVVKTP